MFTLVVTMLLLLFVRLHVINIVKVSSDKKGRIRKRFSRRGLTIANGSVTARANALFLRSQLIDLLISAALGTAVGTVARPLKT